MAQDATGTVSTLLSIPKYNTAADAPSGKGLNAIVDYLDSIIVPKPSGITSGEGVIWNGSSWARSSVTKLGLGSIAQGGASTSDILTWNGSSWAPATPTATTAKKAFVYRTTAQSIPNNAWTAIQFDNESFDTDTFHDNATNNTRLTIPATGYYMITGSTGFVASASGSRMWKILLNGTTDYARTGFLTSVGTITSWGAPSVFINATAADYFELCCWQTSGGSLNTDTGSTSYFSIFQVL